VFNPPVSVVVAPRAHSVVTQAIDRRIIPEAALPEPFSGATNARALQRSDASEGACPGGTTTTTYLNDHHGTSVEADEVNFEAADPQIPFQKSIPLGDEKGRDSFLCRGPGLSW